MISYEITGHDTEKYVVRKQKALAVQYKAQNYHKSFHRVSEIFPYIMLCSSTT